MGISPEDGPVTEETDAMFRQALFASLIALAAAGPALAEGANSSGDGGGTFAHAGSIPGARSGSVVGGGVVSLSGGGDNQTFTYFAPQTQAQSGWIASLSGGGNDAQVTYAPAAPSVSTFAQTAPGAPRS